MINRKLFYVFSVSLSLLFPSISKGQLNEVGGAIVNVTYIGDINQSFLPSKLNPGISFFYRRNSKNYATAFRGQFSYLKIAGGSSNEINLGNADVSFNNSVLEFDLLAEYNFLNFGKQLANSSKSIFFTPYVFGGLGVSYTLSSSSSIPSSLATTATPPTYAPVIPIGIGLKALINPYLILGTEFTLRKTFTDKIDGLDSDAAISSSIGNDLYYSIGVTLSYIFRGIRCPIPTEREPKGRIIKERL